MRISDAIQATNDLLADLPRRRAHALACGRVAEHVTRRVFGAADERVVAAAYLHDIGYAHSLVTTGCHSLDGAAWLAESGESGLASLVAHHSAAHCEADERGLAFLLAAYPLPRKLEADILAYCDFHSGPSGEPMTLDERVRDIHERYPNGHFVRIAVTRAMPQLRESMRTVEALLAG